MGTAEQKQTEPKGKTMRQSGPEITPQGDAQNGLTLPCTCH
jgi:hypothetical protein